jgi:ribosomal protein L11 methyltransferase
VSDELHACWIQLTLEAGQCTVSELEDALLDVGAVAVTLQDAAEDAVFEPLPGETPLWLHTRVTGLFDAQTDIEAIKQRLRERMSDGLSKCLSEPLEEREWVRVWMDEFHPMRFGKRLWICPTCEPPPDPGAVTLMLDPGLAFGTGTHPTTALCLEWLDAAKLSGMTVVDYGCGSGVLGIAAAKLGASHVRAVDLDPQALLATTRNAQGNGVASIVATTTPEKLSHLRTDLVLANILAGPLIELAPHFDDLLAAGGTLVLSGILDHQADAVRAAYEQRFKFGASRRREDWVLLEATRNP